MPHQTAHLGQFMQTLWTETGAVVTVPFTPETVQEPSKPAQTGARKRAVDEPNERQPAIICPRCQKPGKQYSPQIAICPPCYQALWDIALAWTDADYVRAWLHSRIDASGFPVEDSALTVHGADRMAIKRRLDDARKCKLDWRVLPLRMTTAARLKLLVAAVTEGKPAPFIPIPKSPKTPAKASKTAKTSPNTPTKRAKTAKTVRARKATA